MAANRADVPQQQIAGHRHQRLPIQKHDTCLGQTAANGDHTLGQTVVGILGTFKGREARTHGSSQGKTGKSKDPPVFPVQPFEQEQGCQELCRFLRHRGDGVSRQEQVQQQGKHQGQHAAYKKVAQQLH